MNCWAKCVELYFSCGCGAAVAVELRVVGIAFSCLYYCEPYLQFIYKRIVDELVSYLLRC